MSPFAVIVMIDTTDVVFAMDSIPAIFAITSSAFVVWNASAFAVLRLRPLYFMLASMIDRSVYRAIGAKFFYSGIFDSKVPI